MLEREAAQGALRGFVSHVADNLPRFAMHHLAPSNRRIKNKTASMKTQVTASLRDNHGGCVASRSSHARVDCEEVGFRGRAGAS